MQATQKHGIIRYMHDNIQIPEDILRILPAQGLERNVKEALVLKLYTEDMISVGKVGELLNISRHEAELFLSAHNVTRGQSVEDYNREHEDFSRFISG